MAAANLAVVLTGLVTGPLIGRALGPEGRGLLAAIVVPLSLATLILQLSGGEFATRAVARGVRPGTVVGSLAPQLVALGLLGTLVFIPLSEVLSAGESTVETYLLVGACILPLGVLSALFVGVGTGLHRWSLVAAAQSIPTWVYAAAIVVLFLLDELTVTAAAITTMATGLLVYVPLARLRSDVRGVRREKALSREARAYGFRAAIGVIAVTLNGRLDQILMFQLADAEQLGLYAVAVTLALAPNSVISALSSAIFPRVAAGETGLIARSCRVSMLATAVAGVGVAVLAYPMLRFLFGEEFTSAIWMVLILLVAQVVASGSLVLGYSLRSLGHPGTVSLMDVAGLVLTVPGLILLLPGLGGVGAALVSLIAYAITFFALVIATARHTGEPAARFVRFGAGDAREVRAVLAPQVRRLLGAIPGRRR